MKYLLCLVLVGCGNNAMTRKQVIKAIGECRESGLRPKAIRDVFTLKIEYVECVE